MDMLGIPLEFILFALTLLGFALLAIVFVLSSFLDNIAAALIGGTMARAVFRNKVHIGYLAAIVAASNAGGSGSVVGDTTTTMTWIDGVNPVVVLEAYVAAAVALVVSGVIAARQQQAHAPIIKDAKLGHRVDWARAAGGRGGLPARRLAEQPVRKPGRSGEPQRDENPGGDPVAAGTILQPRRALAAVGHHLRGDQRAYRQHAERDDQQLVEQSQHRDEVRNQVDGAEGIGHHRHGQQLRVPGHPRVASGVPERQHLPLQRQRRVPPAPEQGHGT
jgi:hypothetical protein